MPSLIVYLTPPTCSGLPVLSFSFRRTGAVEHLEVLQRVLVDDDHVGEHAGADDAELRRLALRLAQRQRAVHRRRLDDLERMEAGFLQHLQLVDVAEAVGLVDEAGVGAGRDAAAHLLVVVHQLEPHLVEVAPRDFVFGRPVVPVRAVVRAARRVEVHQRRQRVLVVPLGVAERHHVAAGRVDGERRIEHGAELQVLLEVRLPLRDCPARRSCPRAARPGRSATARRCSSCRPDTAGRRSP